MIRNAENICRICTIQSELILYRNIFEIRIQNAVFICDALAALSELVISKNDGLPQVVCSECERRLGDAFHLKIQAASTARLLAAMINSSNVPTALRRGCDDGDDDSGKPAEQRALDKSIDYTSSSTNVLDNNSSKTERVPSPLSDLKVEDVIGIIHNQHEDDILSVNHTCHLYAEIKEESLLKLDDEDTDKIAKPIPRKTSRILKDKNPIRCKVRRIKHRKSLSEKKQKLEKIARQIDSLLNNTKQDPSKCDQNESAKKIEVTETNAKFSIDAVNFLLQNNSTDKPVDQVKREAYEKRKHKCEVCDKRFIGKSNLIDHLRYHANVKPFQCPYCDRKFVQAGSLKCHIRTHTREKPYVCNFCKKTFSQASGLKVHIRTHTNERNYNCAICLKAFVSKGDLTKHQRIHDPIKKFICDICNWGFAQKCNLDKHKVLIHSQSTTKDKN